MFTGLVDDVGLLEQVSHSAAGLELRIHCRYGDLIEGESIAVNGVCLTVRTFGAHPSAESTQDACWFTAAAVATTLERTTLADWKEGQRVNLERALKVGDRLGGHLVQGHVDGVGTVVALQEYEDALLVDIEISPDLFELMVPHGSITIDGVSLTVNDLPKDGVVQVSLIEYTRQHTALDDLRVGSRVHVEGDVIGKYVRRLTTPYLEAHR